MPEETAIPYLLELAQRRQDRVFEEDISNRSTGGIQYAASLLYAEFLGLRVIGRKPAWVLRLRRYPLAVPDNLRSGVRRILAERRITLTDDGQLIQK